jgi:hypothetical protein
MKKQKFNLREAYLKIFLKLPEIHFERIIFKHTKPKPQHKAKIIQ